MPSSSRPCRVRRYRNRLRTALGVELGLERGASDRPELERPPEVDDTSVHEVARDLPNGIVAPVQVERRLVQRRRERR